MNINVNQIEGYSEMSAEEKVKALEGLEIPEADYTGYVKKDIFDKKASELADMTKKYRSTLSEKDQLEASEADKRAEMGARLAQLEAEKLLTEVTAKYVEIGYDSKMATETAKAFVDGDMAKVFKAQKQFVEKSVADAIANTMASTPKPGAGDGDNTPTRDDISRMSLSEKQALYAKDPDSYKTMFGGER